MLAPARLLRREQARQLGPQLRLQASRRGRTVLGIDRPRKPAPVAAPPAAASGMPDSTGNQPS
jgi:hypothetical protein